MKSDFDCVRLFSDTKDLYCSHNGYFTKFGPDVVTLI